MKIKRFLLIMLTALFLVGCGDKGIENSSDVRSEETRVEKKVDTDDDDAVSQKAHAEKNVYTLDGIGAGGTVTLHDDNSVELDIGGVHYIGYVTPTEYEQNYRLSAIEPNFNFSYLVSGEDVQIHYLDGSIALIDVDAQGNECYIGSIVNMNYNTDPTKPASSKAIEASHQTTTCNPLYFARFITVVDDGGQELYKIAQYHSSEGFLLSGQISADGKTFDKNSDLKFYDETGRHIAGTYADEITLAVEGDAYMEIVLSLVDGANGTYTQKSITTADQPFSRSPLTVNIDTVDHSNDTIVTQDGEYTWDEYYESNPDQDPNSWGN